MKYNKIIIKNYSSIFEVELDVKPGKIIPILGLNGSGKSNVLKAIYDFEPKKTKKVKNRTNIFNQDGRTEIIIYLKEIEEDFYKKMLDVLEASFKSQGQISALDKEIKEALKERIIEKQTSRETGFIRKFDSAAPHQVIDFLDISAKYESTDKFELFKKEASKNYGELVMSLPKIKYFSTVDFDDFFDEEIKFENTDSIEDDYKLSVINNIILKTTEGKHDLLSFNNLNGDAKERVTKRINQSFNEILIQDGRLNELNGGINTEVKLNLVRSYDSNETKISFTIVEDYGEEDNLLDDENRKQYEANYGSDGFKFMLNYYISILFENNMDGTIFLFDEPTNFVSDKIITILYSSISKLFSEYPNSSVFLTTHNPFGLNWKYMNPNDVLVIQKEKRLTKLENINQFISRNDDNETKTYIDKLFMASGISRNAISFSPTKINVLVEGITDWRVFNNFSNYPELNFIFMNGYSDISNLKSLLENKNVISIIDNNESGDEKRFINKILKENEQLKSKIFFLSELGEGINDIEDLFDLSEFSKMTEIDNPKKSDVKIFVSKNTFESDLYLNQLSMPKTSEKVNNALKIAIDSLN